jgi:hypothetical protein
LAIVRLAELDIHGRAATAAQLTLQAGAAALGGQDSDLLFDRAIAAWRALRLPLRLALCLADRERVATPARAGGEIQAILGELGANGLLRALHPVAR